MGKAGTDERTQTVCKLLQDLFEIGVIYSQGQNLVLSLTLYYDKEKSIQIIRDRLTLAGYRFSIDERADELLLTIDPRPKLRVPPLNIVLFVVTLVSVYLMPVLLRYLPISILESIDENTAESLTFWQELKLTASAFPAAFNRTMDALAQGVGIEFTLALISILFVHEMGHFIASRRRNIITSWPYFIPAPNIIGTFGAVIKSKTPFWNRRDLIEVGAAGPIAGWVVAVCWLWYGLSQSVYLPQEALPLGEFVFSLEGESILMRISTLLLVGAAPDGYFYKLTEAAFAGWVGLLVTALNLLPIGQLDGGHILYGLGRRRQFILGFLAMLVLLILGIQSPLWWFFALFGLVFGIKHPPTLDDNMKPGKAASAMAIAAIVIMILSFTPVPFR